MMRMKACKTHPDSTLAFPPSSGRPCRTCLPPCCPPFTCGCLPLSTLAMVADCAVLLTKLRLVAALKPANASTLTMAANPVKSAIRADPV